MRRVTECHPLVHEALHKAEELAVVVPDVHLGHNAPILIAVSTLRDQLLQGMATACQHDVGGRQGQRGAQVICPVPAVHNALVGVLPAQIL